MSGRPVIEKSKCSTRTDPRDHDTQANECGGEWSTLALKPIGRVIHSSKQRAPATPPNGPWPNKKEEMLPRNPGRHICSCAMSFTDLCVFPQVFLLWQINFLFRYNIDGLRKDMIYQQAFQAAKISYVVNMVSTSYVQVSQDHVMSRIAGTCWNDPLQFASEILLLKIAFYLCHFMLNSMLHFMFNCNQNLWPNFSLN